MNWGGTHWRQIIGSDGKGYYAYLPAVFIYHDLNLGFFDNIENTYASKETRYDYRASDGKGHVFDKYFCGTAVVLLPFFLTAHAVSLLSGLPADGYSKMYQIAVNLAAVFYLCMGLVFLQRMLLLYNRNLSGIAFVLLCFTFGTNLFYYAVNEPAMSHVYSFFCITLFIYQFLRYSLEGRFSALYYGAFFYGLLLLIRPVNGLILFALPFVAGDYGSFKSSVRRIFSYPFQLLLLILIPLLVFSIQLFLYKAEAGAFFVDAYRLETFDWSHPQVLNILFSYKKGLFVYTPLILLSFVGLFFLFRESRFRFFSFLLFFGLLTYVLSSWWCWYYGGSFGLRAYVEYYSLFAILLSLGLASVKNKFISRTYRSVLVLAIFLSLLQTYQYRYYLIHWSDMNREKYWKVFLKLP